MTEIEFIKFVVEVILLVLFVGIAVMVFIIMNKLNKLVDSAVELKDSIAHKIEESAVSHLQPDSKVAQITQDAQIIGSTLYKAATLLFNFIKNGRKKRNQ